MREKFTFGRDNKCGEYFGPIPFRRSFDGNFCNDTPDTLMDDPDSFVPIFCCKKHIDHISNDHQFDNKIIPIDDFPLPLTEDEIEDVVDLNSDITKEDLPSNVGMIAEKMTETIKKEEHWWVFTSQIIGEDWICFWDTSQDKGYKVHEESAPLVNMMSGVMDAN